LVWVRRIWTWAFYDEDEVGSCNFHAWLTDGEEEMKKDAIELYGGFPVEDAVEKK